MHIDLLDIVRSDCHSSFLECKQLQHLIGFIPRLTLSELVHVHYSLPTATINLRKFEVILPIRCTLKLEYTRLLLYR